jgi:rod shape determining protein RodA
MMFVPVLLISFFGLITMKSFTGETQYFTRQFVWIGISTCVFFIASGIDWRFLKSTRAVVTLFIVAICLLLSLFIMGSVFKGAQSWFSLGIVSFQPANFVELVVILILAKYFSRRHIEIANMRHVLVSGLYVFSIFILVMLQPDFGSAVIIFFLWLGMVLVSGISKKHLFLVSLLAVLSFGGLWFFVFKPYQKERVKTFLHPLTNVLGSGYNVYQSTIAIGSGQLLGKGVGLGTQSKLEFLPEYQTDFIFAAFAEEWGFVGVILLFVLYAIVFWRMLLISSRAASNFEILFGLGLVILFLTHTIIHIGTNVGLLPVTGNTLPFMSYGGSHLLTEFFGLGVFTGLKKYARSVHKEVAGNEMVGL